MTAAADIASLLGKLQDRITRTASETRQNTDAVATLRDENRLRTGTLAEETMDLRTDVRQVNDQIDKMNDKITTVAGAHNDVKHENDIREQQQTLRDQSNVQSLVNLRDSTQKAFKQVGDDVAKLDTADRKLSDRVTEVEKFTSDLVERAKNLVRMPAPAPSLPSDHVWVNKKLTGVYDTTTDLEVRMRQMEERFARFFAPAPAQPQKFDTGSRYMGFDVRFKGWKLVLESKDDIEIFVPSAYDDIVKLESRSYGLQISLKSGSQYALVGGPNTGAMYLMCLVKA
jgi:hypothetical protein